MGGFSRFRKENNPHSNTTKTVTATDSEQVDDSSERTSPCNYVEDASIQNQIRSNDHHQEESNAADETGHNVSLSIRVPDQPHDGHSQRDTNTFDSIMMEHQQESHFDINDSIMDICDLNFANFENDDSILPPYSNGDDEFHVHDEFQNDGDQEKEQVSQTSSNQKSSSGGLNLFRNRKKPLPHVEGEQDHEMNVTEEEEGTDTLHGEKEQDDSAVKSISNDHDERRHEDVCQTSSDEPFVVDESRVSSEPQGNMNQKSASPQVSHGHDNNNDMELDQVETEKEMETIDVVVMGSSLDDVKSVSDDYKSSSNLTEESNGIDGDAMLDKNTVSATNDLSVSTTSKDAISTTCVDEVTIGTPHVGMPEPPSSVPRKNDDIAKKSGSTSATDIVVVSLEGTNTKPFERVSASTQRVLPMPLAPRNASSTSTKISVERGRQMEPTMPAPMSRNIADVSRTDQRPYVPRVIPDSSSKSLPRIIPRMNQTPIRPRTTTATTTAFGNSTNSMTNLNCGTEAREGMNPITPSPGSNWNHDNSREKNITPESRTGLAAAPNHSISQIKQISNSSVEENQKNSSHNEKEAKFDAFKDKFEKDIVESNDAWDRSDAELIELNLGLVMMDNMALRLHGKYGELLEDIEELLVS